MSLYIKLENEEFNIYQPGYLHVSGLILQPNADQKTYMRIGTFCNQYGTDVMDGLTPNPL